MIKMIANGSLVRCKDTGRLGLGMSNPKEKPMKMSPGVTHLTMVIDVLWNGEGFELDVPLHRLERIDKNIRR